MRRRRPAAAARPVLWRACGRGMQAMCPHLMRQASKSVCWFVGAGPQVAVLANACSGGMQPCVTDWPAPLPQYAACVHLRANRYAVTPLLPAAPSSTRPSPAVAGGLPPGIGSDPGTAQRKSHRRHRSLTALLLKPGWRRRSNHSGAAAGIALVGSRMWLG